MASQEDFQRISEKVGVSSRAGHAFARHPRTGTGEDRRRATPLLKEIIRSDAVVASGVAVGSGVCAWMFVRPRI